MFATRHLSPRTALAPGAALAVLVALAPGCSEEELARLNDALDKERAARAKETAAREELEKEVEPLREKAKDLEDDAARLPELEAAVVEREKELGDLRVKLGVSAEELEKAKVKAAELAKKSTEMKALNASLEKEIKAGSIELLEDRIRLKDKILFDSGSAELNADGKKAIAILAGAFKKLGKKRIFQVTGHTDNVGAPADNFKLSMDRALTVTLELMKHGVTPKLLTAAGFGEFHPVCPKNDSADCKAANRRIDILLLPNLDLTPDAKDDKPAAAAKGPATGAPAAKSAAPSAKPAAASAAAKSKGK